MSPKLVLTVGILLGCLACTRTTRTSGDEPERFYAGQAPQISPQISFLGIHGFCQDSLGYMWIATLGGLNRYNGYEFLHFKHDASDSTSISHDFVFSVFLDSSHRLWAGTAMGVNRYDFAGKGFERFHSNPPEPVYSFFEDHTQKIWVATPGGPGWIDTLRKKIEFPWPARQVNLYWEDAARRLWMGLSEKQGLAVLRNDQSWDYFTLPGEREVTCQYTDPQGLWWLGTNSGIVLFDPASRSFRDLPAPCLREAGTGNTRINFIREVAPLKILIGTTTHGVFLYDFISRTLTPNEEHRYNPFSSAHLLSCYVDRQENTWIGSYDKGFTVVGKYPDYFNADPVLSDLFKDKFVTRIAQDNFGGLWVSARYEGLYHYSPEGEITVYNPGNSNLFPEGKGFLESLFIDSQNRIWIGFDGQLVVGTLSPGGNIRVQNRIDIENVRTIREDRSGGIWLGSWSGLYKLTGQDDGAMKWKKVYSSNIPDICILDSGELLFSSYEEGIFKISPTDTIPRPVRFPGDVNQVAQRCVTLFEDSQKRIWLGSYGRGMLLYSPEDSRPYTRKDGLPNDNVLCFQEDTNGHLWMSTSFGISRLAFSASDTVFTNYSGIDGTQGNQFHEKAGQKLSDGRIFFAGNHGLTFFNPELNLPVNPPPPVHLEDLKILNHSIHPQPGKAVLTQDIAVTGQITLDHRQTTFSIDYAGIDFRMPEKLTYAYKMEGFDPEWNKVGDFRRAAYSNLPPGKYTFLVRAVNGDGVESIRPTAIRITVKPAPWFSWQAWTLYILIVVSVIVLLFRFWFKINMNRQLLEIEHNERIREQEISEMKINFFTNISHELRTPLTLISAPLEQLASNKSMDGQHLWLLNTISRNVQSMLRLINQLLDFRKVENGILNLQVRPGELIQRLQEITDAFSYLAERKKIDLVFLPHVPHVQVWTDKDKVEKIMHNLLSNALKYTPENGSVNIYSKELTGSEAVNKYKDLKRAAGISYLEISVSDTGQGVPEEKFGELFLRYRQINGPSGIKPDYSGSGIGLHYTKCLVEKHNGQILAEIKPDAGMVFSFVLPLEDVYSDLEKGEAAPEVFPEQASPNIIGSKENDAGENSYTILLAEDNVELADFITHLLSRQYRLLQASDGVKAWEMIQSQPVDLILSDVIMPGISGYELCAQVKQHPAYCHIPVVLLTAKSMISEQIEGLEQGADAYICKPFHMDYLLLTIKNLFLSRDRLCRYFSAPSGSSEPVVPVTLNKLDRIFVEKLTNLLELELSNPDINIDYIARELGFSRTGFYRKIKGLTDMPPLDFVNNYRMKRAAEKIMENTYTFRDIAEQTGFNSLSYFSKSFKKHFGISPKEYLMQPNKI